MDSEHLEPRKATEYCAVQHGVHTPPMQLPHSWNFLQTSQFGKGNRVDSSELSQIFDKQPERKESQPECIIMSEILRIEAL